MSPHLSLVTATETIFFSVIAEKLRQWVMVTVDNRLAAPLSARVTITAGGEEVVTPLELAPGVREYCCYAPALWPDRPPDRQAQVRLTAGEESVTTTTSVGRHRPWTIYLLSDVCTDYTWVYDDEEMPRAHDAAITEAELTLAEAMVAEPPANHNHYNFVHAREVEFFLEHYPEQTERLFAHLRQGTITLNPFFNKALTGDMSLEELIRQFYPARTWARQYGLELGYANHQETPTITWAMATVLAGSGVNHLVKSILPYECPWAIRLEEPPVFIWEGPDGSRVLVRRRNKDYVEGNFVLRDLRTTTMALHDEIIPAYERLNDQYPFNAIALVGCYGDLSPQSKDLPARKAATIAAYNAQGWAYPRLVNAAHRQFWADLEAQIAGRHIQLPVYRGDYGSAWETWPVSLAYDFAAWRRAQERAGTADKLAAILSRLEPDEYEAQRQQLARGWLNLTYLADHAWNGANDANRAFNASLRRRWQETAHQAFDAVIAAGLATLGRRLPAAEADRILVFNGLGWARSGLVRLAGFSENTSLIDLATGAPVATQMTPEGDFYFEARDVPSVGYRVFEAQPQESKALAWQSQESKALALPTEGQPPVKNGGWTVDGCRLEGPYYAIEVSPVTGGLVSLYDKTRQRELVDPQSPYCLNQCLYLSDEVEHTPQLASVRPGPAGPLFAQLVARTSLKNLNLITTFTLYTHLDRVDIHNEVEKIPTTERHELNFAFPFLVPNRQYRFEAPGAIITPGGDQRPGAGQAVTAVRHFVDVFNDEFGVTFSQADSGLVEFGRRTSTEDPLEPDPANSTLLTLALASRINWREVTRDQAGATRFTFRYRLRGHSGGFDPTSAVRFGWEDNNELLAISLPGVQGFSLATAGQQKPLPPDVHSFVTVTPENVILASLKVAEEEGLLLRLWECMGQDATAFVKVSGLGSLQTACQTDLLERDAGTLNLTGGQIPIPVRPRGLAAARLLLT